jgi:hypothetical protein
MTAPVTGERPCRGCASPIPRGRARPNYCEACRQTQCRECGRYRGQHAGDCRWDERTHRPAPVVHDVVTPDALAELYAAQRRVGIRMARALGLPTPDAEDATQVAITSMVARRPYLRAASVPYFWTAVRHAAIGWAIRTRRRHVVAVGDGTMLAQLEAARYARDRGRPGLERRHWPGLDWP